MKFASLNKNHSIILLALLSVCSFSCTQSFLPRSSSANSNYFPGDPVSQNAGLIEAIPTQTAELPTQVTDGTIINLNCGTVYVGTLDLKNLSHVTVQTQGSCGRAVITPAVPVSGWKPFKGNIFVAEVSKPVAQVFVDSQLVGVAHYPNSFEESGWLIPTSTTATSLSFTGLPSNDLIGAQVNYRGSYPWAIGSRTVAAYDGQTLQLPANTDLNLNAEDTDIKKFYLEGKLWMLDSPGEWAWDQGKLYLWMPDGSAPDARVLAAPETASVIDARASSNLTIHGVRIVGGRIGIDASFSDQFSKASSSLQIIDSEIAYSNWSGIYATDASGLSIENSDVTGSLHTGLYARYGSTFTRVENSRFTNINFIGMHKGSDGSIYLNSDQNANVINNTISNSGKSGIFLGSSSHSLIKGNRIDGACRIHGDCGGIYLFDRDQVPLQTRIESNTLRNINGTPVRPGNTSPERYAIYLDDYSTGVTVINNDVSESDSGMQLHGAFNNIIMANSFSENQQQHILFSDGGLNQSAMHDNSISGNTFKGPTKAYYLAVSNPQSAGIFQGNTYLNYGSSAIGIPSAPFDLTNVH